MLKSYFKTAWRALMKNKLLSAINMVGLSAGIAFVFLIGSFVWSEYQVNRPLDPDRTIYMVRSEWKDPNMGMDFTSPAPIGQALREEYPHLVSDFHHFDGLTIIAGQGEKVFRQSTHIGDSNLLTFFRLPLLHGDAKTALNQPYTLVITKEQALRYFGKTDVVGQTLRIQTFTGSHQDFNITGVLDDMPFNTMMNYHPEGDQFFLSASSLRIFQREAGFRTWQNMFIINYIKLQPGKKPEDLTAAVDQ
ncbi:MAG TPA: ABC transporter permease, partial [Chitinophagaceae bacterium]|nr:ABC transporter permease [Chitinophagaceae bacterium]